MMWQSLTQSFLRWAHWKHQAETSKIKVNPSVKTWERFLNGPKGRQDSAKYGNKRLAVWQSDNQWGDPSDRDTGKMIKASVRPGQAFGFILSAMESPSRVLHRRWWYLIHILELTLDTVGTISWEQERK